MKKRIIAVVLLQIIFFSIGCKEREKNVSDNAEIRKAKYGNLGYEYITDIPVDVDYEALIRFLKREFPADSVLNEFGPGTHTFYLSYYHCNKDLISFFKTLTLGQSGDPFGSFGKTNCLKYYQEGFKIFKVRKNEDSKKVICKYYEVKIGIDKKKNNIYPWTVTELDARRYFPHFKEKNNNKKYVSGRFSTIIGGYEALSSKIIYPDEAREKGVSGKVIVIAYVEKSGEVAGTQLSKGIGFGCDEAALKAVSEMKFYPTGGRFFTYVPIDFELEYKPETYDLTSNVVKFKPEHINVNEKCTIEFNVVNYGNKKIPTSEYKTSMYIGKELVFMTIGSPAIVENKEAKFYVPWTPRKAGTYEYTIYVDEDNILKESNRGNNIVKGKITVY